MNERRSFPINIIVNGRQITEVVIDSHYKKKHQDINDALILDLVKTLDGLEFKPEEREGAWEFFMQDRIEHGNKFYRLVWCMQDACLFIGVINCFRR